MPALNWDNFTKLGSPEKNFELLCRGIVRQNFGGHGVFRALANQPGVEFHLKMEEQHNALGDSGRWWGWQCKWYTLAENGSLGATRRKDIQDGIRKAEKHVSGLTDWVLWTRRTLTKDDQKWFNGLSSKMQLHLWTEDEINNYLSGQAAVLRSTYFGELVLTPEILRERHDQAVAPIRSRWLPDVHHVREAELDLRRKLGEISSWDVLRTLSADLREKAKALESAPVVPSSLTQYVSDVVATTRHSAEILDQIGNGIENGDLDRLRDEISSRPLCLPMSVATAPRRLRSGNHRAALYATNAVASCYDVIRVLDEVESAYASRLVAILVPAGCGKTHFAAQLTAGTKTRPYGVLLHGRDLHATHSLDDLARSVSIAAVPVPSMEALLAAVDAAGQRAHRRLPVFIDGLNESEEPRTWKPLLAALETTLAKYPYVLLVCTLRPDFANDALPERTQRIEFKDYGEESIDAIQKYFLHWKIDATDTSLPINLLRHPLTLRLFCEVTNPNRQQNVGVNAMPGSLTTLFERYLEQVGLRVAELAHRSHRFYAHDVTAAIANIANKLWESRSRSIEFTELKNLLGDTQRPWDQTLVRALEHESVLLRIPSNGNDTFVPVYDLLGGHIIANALLAKQGQDTIKAWLKKSSTTTMLSGNHHVCHPLAHDVLQSLVDQIPKRFYAKQLWQLVDEPMRGRALRLAARLDPTSLDTVTVEALLALVHEGETEILDRLWELRGIPNHPLNAEMFDRALRTMTVAERDLRWTEWIRRHQDEIITPGASVLHDLESIEKRWQRGHVSLGDQLRARWVMWTLTSTVRRLRDQATRTLYWFGRIDCKGLFDLTIDSLFVNDAYVGERMLAAAYGVVMSHQRSDKDFGVVLKPFLEQLASAFVGASASAPTHHYLMRLYVRGIVAFTTKFYASILPSALRGTWAFATPLPIQSLAKGAPGVQEAEQTLHSDFKNYTLGRLFDDRENYDMDHVGHQTAVAYVRGVVWALGWRTATFSELDSRITDGVYHGRGNRSPVERYGKKYGWIGFFTYAGILEDQGLLPRESFFSDVNIDPSFPEKSLIDGSSSSLEAWLSPSIESHEIWVRENTVPLSPSLIRRETISGHKGPWLAVRAYVSAKDKVLGRCSWGFLSAMLVSKEYEGQLVATLKSGKHILSSPDDYYTFAGEIPWHPQFASLALDEDAYMEKLQIGFQTVNVEILFHNYAWESYHSEMNRAGNTLVPSQLFSKHFNLHCVAQSFDHYLPDTSPATITLDGINGLEGDILYIREDLLRQYAAGRAIVWSAFGERELYPCPPTRPDWLLDAQRRGEDTWNMVITEKDLIPSPRPTGKKTPKTVLKVRQGIKTTVATSKKSAKKTARSGTRKKTTSRKKTS